MRHALIALLLVGCAPSLESELRQAGRFAGLQAFEAAGQGYAAALAEPEAGRGRLTLVRLDDGASCTAGLGVSETFYPRRGPGDALGLVSWEPADAGGAIAFYDARCRPLMDPIPCSGAPRAVEEAIFGGAYRHHLAITTEDERFLLVDPWAGDVIELSSEPVHAFRWVDQERTWLHTGSSLVLAGLDGSVARMIGEAVSEVAFTAGRNVAYLDGGRLFLLRSETGEPELLAEDACELRALGAREALGYLSPCAQRTLVVHDLAGDALEVAHGVASFRPDMRTIFFVEGDTARDLGRLSAFDEGKLTLVDEEASLASVRTISDKGSQAHLVLRGADPDRSDLLHFDGSARLLHRAVARFDVRHHHLAVLTDLAGGSGQLWLREDGGNPKLLASGVPRDGFGYASQLQAIAFIADSQGGAGRLEVLIFPTGDRLTVATGVSELAELRSDATPGLAYLVPNGPEAGIWFAAPQ